MYVAGPPVSPTASQTKGRQSLCPWECGHCALSCGALPRVGLPRTLLFLKFASVIYGFVLLFGTQLWSMSF